MRIRIVQDNILRDWAKDKVQKSLAEALNRFEKPAPSVGSRARVNHAHKLGLGNKPNKQNVSEINLFKKFNFSQCQNNC